MDEFKRIQELAGINIEERKIPANVIFTQSSRDELDGHVEVKTTKPQNEEDEPITKVYISELLSSVLDNTGKVNTGPQTGLVETIRYKTPKEVVAVLRKYRGTPVKAGGKTLIPITLKVEKFEDGNVYFNHPGQGERAIDKINEYSEPTMFILDGISNIIQDYSEVEGKETLVIKRSNLSKLCVELLDYIEGKNQ